MGAGMGEQVQEYRGEKIVVRFDGDKCIHSRNCVLGRPEVFQANVPGAWIKPDSVSPDEVALTARACPSGAITYERIDGGPQEAPPPVNLARVRENGPLALHAEYQDRRRDRAPASDVMPLWSVEKQTLLRRQPQRGRFPGNR